MKKFIILLTILLTSGICSAETRIVAETNFSKAVNWNSGFEIVVKGTTKLNDSLDLKYGASEQFAGYRSNPYSMNHDSRRIDIGFLGRISEWIQIGYTHSERIPFAGANEESIYLNKSLDTVTIRWSVDLE